MKRTKFKNLDPPMWVAWNQAIAGIRVRFARHLVTVAGIGLGIAFFSSVQAAQLLHPSSEAFESQRMQWLAATSLLMCLVGVTNSMLMSVTERYREIGTIKCLGASDGFIVKVFLLEAALLGSLASIAGAIAGSFTMALVYGFSASLFGAIGQAFAIGLGMTLIAAIFPAMQAARMPPAAALRSEI